MPITLSATLATAGGSGPVGAAGHPDIGEREHGPELHRDRRGVGFRELHHRQCQPDGGVGADHGVLRGNSYYQSSNASVSETTAAEPSGGGGFVVGDVSAGAPTNGTR